MTNTIQIEGMDELIEAISGGGSGGIVPTPEAADEGKVLTAGDDGTASWEDAPSGDSLPEQSSSTNGKFLSSVYDDKSEESYLEWADAPDGLPEYTSPTDEGKVLQLIPQDVEGNLLPEWTQVNTVPPGGTTGYVLTKTSQGYDWQKVNQVPSDGSSGYILAKTSASTYGWVPPSGGTALYTFKNTLEISEWFDIGDGYMAAISGFTRQATNLLSIMAYAYLNGTNTFVPIVSFGVDAKSGSMNIVISSADYAKLSTGSSSLYVRIVCD